MNYLKVLDRPIAFQRHFVTITGSINAALMLSQAVYWSGRSSLADGWFYKTQAEWEEETGMTRRELDGARKILGEKGLMLEDRRGVPGKLHFKVQVSNLEKLCTETPSAQRTKPPKCMHQTANVNAPKRQCNTETTSETTAETLALRVEPSVLTVFNLPIIGKKEYALPQPLYEEFVETYIGISVMAELSKARSWLITNPTKQKTLSGMPRFLNSWLARAQNDQPSGGFNGSIPNGKANANVGVLSRVLSQAERADSPNQNGHSAISVGRRSEPRALLENS